MAMTSNYAQPEPTRAEIDATQGPAVLEFGASWCGYCMAAQPLFASAFDAYPQVPHIKIEDGKGRRLGRTFGVKLWPTLVFVKNGQEVARLIRPSDSAEIREAFLQLVDSSVTAGA